MNSSQSNSQDRGLFSGLKSLCCFNPNLVKNAKNVTKFTKLEGSLRQNDQSIGHQNFYLISNKQNLLANSLSSHRNLELPPVPLSTIDRNPAHIFESMTLPTRRVTPSVYPNYTYNQNRKKDIKRKVSSFEEPVYASVKRSNSSSETHNFKLNQIHSCLEETAYEGSDMPYYSTVASKSTNAVYSNSSRKSSTEFIDQDFKRESESLYTIPNKSKFYKEQGLNLISIPTQEIQPSNYASKMSKNQTYNECYSQEDSIYSTCATDKAMRDSNYIQTNNSDTLSSTYAKRALNVMHRLLKRLNLSSSFDEVDGTNEGQDNTSKEYNCSQHSNGRTRSGAGSVNEYSGQYRGLIARETIASLRARNAMPLVMFADIPSFGNHQQYSDIYDQRGNYEQVITNRPDPQENHYSIERRRMVIYEETSNIPIDNIDITHSADGVHARVRNQSGAHRTPANDSDAYAEIFDSSADRTHSNLRRHSPLMLPVGYFMPNTNINSFPMPSSLMTSSPEWQHYLQALNQQRLSQTNNQILLNTQNSLPTPITHDFPHINGFQPIAPMVLTPNTSKSDEVLKASTTNSFRITRIFSKLRRNKSSNYNSNHSTINQLPSPIMTNGGSSLNHSDSIPINHPSRSFQVRRTLKRLIRMKFIDHESNLSDVGSYALTKPSSNLTSNEFGYGPIKIENESSVSGQESIYDKPKEMSLSNPNSETGILAEIVQFRHVDSELEIDRNLDSRSSTPTSDPDLSPLNRTLLEPEKFNYEDSTRPLQLDPLTSEEASRICLISAPSILKDSVDHSLRIQGFKSSGPSLYSEHRLSINNISQTTLTDTIHRDTQDNVEFPLNSNTRVVHSSTYEDLVLT